MQDIFQEAISRLDTAVNKAKINQETLLRLKQPKQVVEVAVPLRLDNGALKIFSGFRVQHSNLLGPAKGGIRFHPQVTREEVMALAFWMTLKCALAQLPYGGGKGGVIVDPKDLSKLELERLSRSYIAQIADVIGPDVDVPAPDVYTNAMIMGWMVDEYAKIKRQQMPAVITGKPIMLGGSLGREDATGRGAYFCIKELEKLQQWEPKTKTVAIQGFGNAGQHVAQLLFADGYRILAVSDSQTAIYNKTGLDIPQVIKTKITTKKLINANSDLNKIQTISNAELLELNVDILLPAALENQITEQNAVKIKAPIIVEVANGPITIEADKILTKNNILVVPDILANAGGVIVSYFEWVQNKSGFYWSAAEVQTKLQQKMQAAFKQVYKQMQQQQVDMRTAAYVVALQRLDAAVMARGTAEYFGEIN